MPNLTLIDLPGITQNPVGDQPDDIGLQIKQMVLEYVKRPNCIVLAVTAANTDLANSDAIAIARQVDPEGRRTLGVLTKLDLMDSGTDAAQLLEGREGRGGISEGSGLGYGCGRALGYVGVVNRSQQDINQGKQLVDARQHEQRFFDNHAAYAHPAPCHANTGTAQLVRRCTAILQQHIRAVLPGLAADLGRMLVAKRARLTLLKAEQDPDTRERIRMGSLVAYADAADALVRGLTHTHTRDAHTLALLSSGELVGGARIEERLSTAFAKEVCTALLVQAATLGDPGCNPRWPRLQPQVLQAATLCDHGAQVEARDVFELVSANEILKLAKNMSGLGGGLLAPNRAFDAVVVRYVRSLEEVCLRCVAEVRAELAQLHAFTPAPPLTHPTHPTHPTPLAPLAPLAPRSPSPLAPLAPLTGARRSLQAPARGAPRDARRLPPPRGGDQGGGRVCARSRGE